MTQLLDTIYYDSKKIEIIEINQNKYFYHSGVKRNVLITFNELELFIKGSVNRKKADCGAIMFKERDIMQIDCLTFPIKELKTLIRKYKRK